MAVGMIADGLSDVNANVDPPTNAAASSALLLAEPIE